MLGIIVASNIIVAVVRHVAAADRFVADLAWLIRFAAVWTDIAFGHRQLSFMPLKISTAAGGNAMARTIRSIGFGSY